MEPVKIKWKEKSGNQPSAQGTTQSHFSKKSKFNKYTSSCMIEMAKCNIYTQNYHTGWLRKNLKEILNFFAYLHAFLFFFVSGFSFTNTHDLQYSREGGRYLFNSFLPLPPASQTLRH